jgi:hypothetical protein
VEQNQNQNPQNQPSPQSEIGPRKKPQYCVKNCPRRIFGTGFLADSISDTTKVVLLKYQPSTDEINCRQAIPEKYIKFATQAGFEPNEIGVAYMLRCRNPKDKDPVKDLRKAQKICRYWDTQQTLSPESPVAYVDGGLKKYNPNVFILTFDIKTLEKADAFKVFFAKAFKLAKEFSDKSYRPIIACGPEVAVLLQPELFSTQEFDRDTTFRSWVGHWWIGDWPFTYDFREYTNPKIKKLVEIENTAKERIRNL